MRLFVAVDLPPEIRAGLAELQEKMRALGRGVRWGNVAGIHCTLKFLGEMEEEKLSRLVARLETASTPRFVLRVHGLGVFPGWRNPRVIWVGVDTEAPHLEILQRRIERAVEPLGFPPETRAFKPHLTLGRVRQPQDLEPLVTYMHAQREQVDLGKFTAGQFTLFQSILRPNGAEYRALHHFPLKGDS
ncbi:MAG: RNA 2',3'-cyclic phosphodiesterase [Acidobacteria bacterium]|nr:RNA 2',3'-cyclic phosphodiesterase [Acidobacteriota bacterium]